MKTTTAPRGVILFVAVALLCLIPASFHPADAAGHGEEQRYPVVVGSLVALPESGAAVVFLVAEDEGLYLPITIGQYEASAINRSLQSMTPPRPMTHELLVDVITRMGGQITSVTVASLEKGTFKALITIGRDDGSEMTIDARPSDCIALAVKAGAPLFVAASVMDEAGRSIEDDDDPGPTPDAPRMPAPELIL